MRSIGRQVALVAAALALCPLAALFATRDPAVPLARARALVDAERSLGLFFEPAVHAWLQQHAWLLAAAGFFYVWVHVPALVGTLVWAWIADRARFALLRDWFLATQAVVVAGYLSVPTAPPRFLGGHGFRDTLSQLWGADGAALAHTVQSPYAAMPSGHVAFAVIVAAGLWMTTGRRSARLLAVAYPVLVVLVVVATANHFWLDAAAGALAAGAGLCMAHALRWAPRPLRARMPVRVSAPYRAG